MLGNGTTKSNVGFNYEYACGVRRRGVLTRRKLLCIRHRDPLTYQAGGQSVFVARTLLKNDVGDFGHKEQVTRTVLHVKKTARTRSAVDRPARYRVTTTRRCGRDRNSAAVSVGLGHTHAHASLSAHTRRALAPPATTPPPPSPPSPPPPPPPRDDNVFWYVPLTAAGWG